MPTEPADPMLRPEDVAKLLDVDERTLRDWRSLREGPPYVKLGHRTVRYRRSDLDRWIKRRTITPASAL